MPTLSELLDSLPTYGADDSDDPQGSYLPVVKQAINTASAGLKAIQDFGDDPRNRYPNPYMAGYEQRAAQDAEYQRRNRAQQAYDEYMDPDALQKYAASHPEFAQPYQELQDYRRKGLDVEDQLNWAIEKEPFVQHQIDMNEAGIRSPSEKTGARGASAEASWKELEKRRGSSFGPGPEDSLSSEPVYDDNGTDVSQGPKQQKQLEPKPASAAKPDSAAKPASAVKTGNGEFSTASTAPNSGSDRWGVKFDPNETAKFLFGEGILSQPMAIPDASSRGKTQVTPQMAQQVQALEQVYSTRDPRLIPGNPQFDMFAFADYLLGLRAKNQALYQQRMGGAMQVGSPTPNGNQAPQISPETMAEMQGQLSEAKQLGLQGGVDRYGNRVFYDPKTKKIFKSVAEYKQFVSASNPSVAPSAGERSGMGTD